jgi:hypothetical protein
VAKACDPFDPFLARRLWRARPEPEALGRTGRTGRTCISVWTAKNTDDDLHRERVEQVY